MRLKQGILERAAMNIKEEPVTVTAFIAERSAGDIHDFYSEGDYWWPDTLNPDGPYVRRDGETNPDNFVAHRHAMIRFSSIVGNLTSAYLLTQDKEYVDAILAHVRAWFVNESTKMILTCSMHRLLKELLQDVVLVLLIRYILWK